MSNERDAYAAYFKERLDLFFDLLALNLALWLKEQVAELAEPGDKTVVHGCCGCSCAVCADGHSAGFHSDACQERFYAEFEADSGGGVDPRGDAQ